MIQAARYIHTNLIARDWRRLADFYQSVFGCVPVPPERDLSGPALEAGTGVPGATLAGIHLRLPGSGAAVRRSRSSAIRVSPTDRRTPSIVRASRTLPLRWRRSATPAPRCWRAAVRSAAIVETTIANGARVTWCYVSDPEGNIVELQAWT